LTFLSIEDAAEMPFQIGWNGGKTSFCFSDSPVLRGKRRGQYAFVFRIAWCCEGRDGINMPSLKGFVNRNPPNMKLYFANNVIHLPSEY
jgi:hypothetical protein